MTENIFGKQEVLISCSSLGGLFATVFSPELHSKSQSINQEQFDQLVANLKNELVKRSQQQASNILARLTVAGTKNINEIIREILLARRYRSGVRESNNPEGLLKLIEAKVAKQLPIELTISLYPCKIPNPLKTAGKLPDLGDLASLARLIEIAMTVKQVYKPGARVIVLMDGGRFEHILDFPKENITSYQEQLRKFLSVLEGEEYVELLDYMDLINQQLSEVERQQRQVLFTQQKAYYEGLFGSEVEASNIKNHLQKILLQSSNDGLAKKFVGLYESLLYSVYIPEIFAYRGRDRDSYCIKVFEAIYDVNSTDAEINKLRKKIIEHTWKYALNYIAEISTGRILKPVERVYPSSIRCDMHNIADRLTLYPVNRSTKLTSFHSTGYINKKGNISVALRASLLNKDYYPIYGQVLGENYQQQPFVYVHREFINQFLSADEIYVNLTMK